MSYFGTKQTSHSLTEDRLVKPIPSQALIAASHMSAFDAVDGSSTGAGVPLTRSLLRLPRFGGAKHTTIGFDIANSVFQVHGVDVLRECFCLQCAVREYLAVLDKAR